MSLRKKRRYVSLWFLAATVACLALIIESPWGTDFLSPGPLAAQHRFLEGDCQACHDIRDEKPLNLSDSANDSIEPSNANEKCISCHELGKAAEFAHSVSPDALERITERISQSSSGPSHTPALLSLAAHGPGVPIAQGGEIACSTCHPEHRDGPIQFRGLADGQCQMCHLRSFPSLSTGHPALGHPPESRRTRIIFNHESHKAKHFPKQDQIEFACSGCHELAPSGDAMTIRSYSASCESCHEEDVNGEGYKRGKKGVAFIGIPRLDLKALNDDALPPLGEWPRRGQKKTSRFTNLLLLTTGRLEPEILDTVTGIKRLHKLSKASDEEKAAVIRYAWETKALLHDLLVGGPGSFGEEIEAVTGLNFGPQHVRDLLAELPSSVLLEGQENWFPNLQKEVALYRESTRNTDSSPRGDPGRSQSFRARLDEEASDFSSSEDALEPSDPEDWARHGGWYPYRGAIGYRARGHADPFLRSWLSLSGSVAGRSEQDPVTAAAASALFTSLSRSQNCMRCHSIDRGKNAGFEVNWFAYQRDRNVAPSFEFTHRPHLSVGDSADCNTCHQLKQRELSAAAESSLAAYESPSPKRREMAQDLRMQMGNFAPLETSTCSACHHPAGASDACVSCHSYHRGGINRTQRPVSSLDDLDTASLAHGDRSRNVHQ
jgi:hypothetical protein